MDNWKISSYSATGANCLEASGTWRASSCSDAAGDRCVEASRTPVVGVRDTKDRARGQLVVSEGAWVAFVASLV